MTTCVLNRCAKDRERDQRIIDNLNYGINLMHKDVRDADIYALQKVEALIEDLRAANYALTSELDEIRLENDRLSEINYQLRLARLSRTKTI